tara:strand:+ start:229 stop:444 length:216 start_codon:yes stop_codon:yes gene_type:complete
MKKINSEILEKVKDSLVSEKQKEEPNIIDKQNQKISDNDKMIEKKIVDWLDINGERIAREILREEVKKLFK